MAAKKNTIMLGADELRWALRAAIAAASKQDVTPVLRAVRWIIAGDHVHLVATDRYRVHETLVKKPTGATDGEFTMDRAQAEWILANSHKPARAYPDQRVRISWTDPSTSRTGVKDTLHPGRIEVEIIASTRPDAPVFRYDADAVKGNYPPVHKLFPDMAAEGERAGVVGLNPEYIAGMRYLVGQNNEPLVFTMSKAEAKLGPILVENLAGTARALLQPNLLTAKADWQGGAIPEPAPVAKASAA